MSHSQRFRPVNIGPIHFYATTTDAEAFEGDSFVIVPATDGFYFDTSTNAPVKSRVDFRCVDALGASSIILAGQTGTITANILALSASLTVPSLTVTSLTAASAAITTGLVVTGTTSLAGTSILGDVSIGTAGANKDLLVYGGIAGITGAFTGDVDIDGDLQGNTATYSGNVLCESDLTVQGDTIVQDVYVSDHLQITCTDADPAVVVNQQGTGDILLLEDNGVEVFVLHDGGITKLTGTLEVTGAMVLGSTLDLTGLASLDGGINVDDLFTVSSATGAITGSSTLDVTGLSSLDGGIDVNAAAFTVSTAGAVSAASTLAVTGITTLAGLLNADGGIAIDTSDFTVSAAGAISTLSTLDVTGLSSLDGGIDVNASAFTVSTAGAVSAASTLAVTGITTLAGLLNADGGIAIDTSDFTVSAAGAISTLSTLDVTGLSSLDGGIDVNASAFTVSTAGAVTAASTLDVTSTGSFGDSLTVSSLENAWLYLRADTANDGALEMKHPLILFSGDGTAVQMDFGIGMRESVTSANDAVLNMHYAPSVFRVAHAGVSRFSVSSTGVSVPGDLTVAGDLHVSGTISANTLPTSIARYTTTGTVNIPAGCNGLIIEIVGGGGSGGGYGSRSDAGGGGGGGGYIEIYITKNMISALSLSSIYFVCGTGGASVLGNYNGNDGVASGCYENTSGGTLIAYANPGSAGGRGDNYAGGGYGGSLIPGTAYEDMYKEIRGEFGDGGYDTGTALAHTRGGKGGSSHLGRGGRGGYQLADATPGRVGGGGGGAYYNRGDTSGAGGSGMMQITFY